MDRISDAAGVALMIEECPLFVAAEVEEAHGGRGFFFGALVHQRKNRSVLAAYISFDT